MSLDLLDAALVDLLDDTVVGGHPRPCGYVDVPTGAGWQGEPGSSAFAPYLTVWPTDSDRRALLLTDPHRYLDVNWVVKAVDIDPTAAKTLAAAARTALIDSPIDPPSGLAINWTRISGPRGPYPDQNTVPPLHVVALTVVARIQTVPTP